MEIFATLLATSLVHRWSADRQRFSATGQRGLAADAVFDKFTELDEFTAYAIDEVERVAGETRY